MRFSVGKKPMILRAYSSSDDDFVEDAFIDKRARGSSKADEPVSKKSKKPAISSKPSKTAGKKPMILRAYSPSDDDFVEDAFIDKRARGSSKADEPVSKKSKKPAISSKPSKTAVSSKPSKLSKHSGSSKPSKPSGSSKPSKPSGSSNPEDPKPVLSEDLKPGLNLRQILQPKQDKFPMVKIKNFPGPLYEIINKITMDQKRAISYLGFISLMDFGLNVMPSRLGYLLLERFDAKSGILSVFGETIKITPERVHHTFGFPMGQLKVDVRDVLKERSNENYIEWRNQFGAAEKKPRLYVNKDLLPLIRKQIKKNDSGKLFTMNFICLFSTIFFHVVSTGTLNIAVLPSLVDLTKVRQMNWCKYVVDCMKDERSDWKPGKPFFGPILLLEVIFANYLLKKPKLLAFKYWKTEMLEELEEMMFGKIRKGRAPKAVKTVNEEELEEAEEETKDDDAEKNMMITVKENDDDDDGEEQKNDDTENDDDGAEQNIDYGEEERDDDDQEQIQNAGAESQNVEQPSTKPRWTKDIVSKRGTPEKLGLQMIIENYGDKIEEEKTEEDQIQPVIGEDEDNMLIEYTVKKRQRTIKELIENAGAESQNVEQPSTKPRWTKDIVSKRGTPEKLGLQMIIENYGDEIEEEKTEEDQIQPVIGEDEDNMLIEYTVKKRQRTIKGKQK
ncbi:hypothetical protein CTI12_AA056280 [Artemisia annua]|uniref:Ulp1 protease family, C-terminal catalytic domain-containing protein n=1 Tax=Artemisia annua TaxID=35608 RepID=A0A2U1Q927_ARTAN|nr:hypothetical protein CTI12_AA056280 [Artemisia annua]